MIGRDLLKDWVRAMTKQVLVIDDDEGVREIIQIGLTAVAAWDVLTAASGVEGIAIASTAQPDAILLDVIMTDLNGWETFKQLQANPATRAIPVILLTAGTTSERFQQWLDTGIRGFILKPCKAQDLVMQMRSLLNW
jgi:CheY-like chemotaxis protein